MKMTDYIYNLFNKKIDYNKKYLSGKKIVKRKAANFLSIRRSQTFLADAITSVGTLERGKLRLSNI
jgi:hypothetical protein